jgi:hypothetical protein
VATSAAGLCRPIGPRRALFSRPPPGEPTPIPTEYKGGGDPALTSVIPSPETRHEAKESELPLLVSSGVVGVVIVMVALVVGVLAVAVRRDRAEKHDPFR